MPFLLNVTDFSILCEFVGRIPSFISKGRFAFRIRFVPLSATSMRTFDTSPIECLYTAVLCVVWNTTYAYRASPKLN